jgi:hypothetical protein
VWQLPSGCVPQGRLKLGQWTLERLNDFVNHADPDKISICRKSDCLTNQEPEETKSDQRTFDLGI